MLCLHTTLVNLIKMQIPTIVVCVYTYMRDVSLATIGVCVFCAVYFGSRTFLLWGHSYV